MMVKYCVVVDCINNKEKKTKKNKLKLQKNSFFTVPKETQIIRQWSEILRQNLDFDPKCRQFICDEHFDEKYIIRKDIITIPGEQPFVSERQKIILKRDAIPTLDKKTSASENICESMVVAASEEFVVKEEPVDLMREDGIIEPNIIEEVECINAELSESHTDFSIDDLIKNLETHKLPKKWGWVDDHLDAPAVILCHLDYESYDVKLRVKIDKVLNVIVTNVKISKSVKSEFVISSMNKLWEFLKELERSQMCSGSGFDCPKSSETCTVFLKADEKYKIQAAKYRCKACRRLRNKLHNQLYLPKMDVDEHNRRLKLKLNAVKKKCIRLSNKNETLKQIIKEKRKKCADAKRNCETVIQKEILALPPIQQETIRACFAATK
ncbi:uncharacterized protein LOC122515662 [Polistes fuscatus]|uniref:uncharacterized protein LOC122515662 n=1 Tax=Polistes fuscatus TaxID=30207 RepID=UPI001CA957F2|nr:uncharacterized protein LOC122515662 [Polistes fuscatus]